MHRRGNRTDDPWAHVNTQWRGRVYNYSMRRKFMSDMQAIRRAKTFGFSVCRTRSNSP